MYIYRIQSYLGASYVLTRLTKIIAHYKHLAQYRTVKKNVTSEVIGGGLFILQIHQSLLVSDN